MSISITNKDYFNIAEKWIEKRASLIGGCCGTSPEYISLLAKKYGRV
jgi:S-methylmethionine-dependent homocysteine/selenocysteine methylase